MKKRLPILAFFMLFVCLPGVRVHAASSIGTPVNVSIESYFDSDNIIQATIPAVSYGAKVGFASHVSDIDGYTFCFWIVNGQVMANLPVNYAFTVKSNLNLVAVYKPLNTYVVVFMDANGGKIDIQYITPGEDAVEPDTSQYTKPGLVYAVDKWSETFTNITADTVCVLQYTPDPGISALTLTVENGSGSGSYEINEIAVATADPDTESRFFQYWRNGSRIVSRDRTYAFTMLYDLTLTAVYGPAPLDAAPLLSLSAGLSLREGYTSYLGQFDLPAGLTLIEFGLISHPVLTTFTLETDAVTQYVCSKYNGTTGEFLASLTGSYSRNIRAYLVYQDGEGVLHTIYDEKVASGAAFLTVPVAGGLKVTGYVGDATDVSIPSTIDGLSVVAIATGAFANDAQITRLVIPDSVQTIEAGALAGLSSLKTLSIPFAGESRTALYANGLFGYVFGTTSYPGSVASTEYYYYNYSTNHNTVFYLPATLKDIHLTSATKVASGAFTNAPFDSITLASTITTIESYAFANSSFVNVVFASGGTLTAVRDHAFYRANKITSLNFPNGLLTIGRFAFDYMTALSTIYLPASLVDPANEQFVDSKVSLLIYCGHPSKPGTWSDYWTNVTRTTYWNQSIHHQVTFVDEDGTVLKTATIFTDGAAAIAPSNPTKTGYTFTGWDTGYGSITSDLWVEATYDIFYYTATFKDYDGTTLSTSTVLNGTAATAPASPTRVGYQFNGWDTSFASLTGNITVTATYTPILYTATFLNDDGSPLGTSTVGYGESATAPSVPGRSNYYFSGWDTSFSFMTASITVRAIFHINQYTVTFYDWDGSVLQSSLVDYQSSVVPPDDFTRTGYTFNGWSPWGPFDSITYSQSFTACYDINRYAVTFLYWNGATLSSQMVNYGSSAQVPDVPTRTGYTFTGWDRSFAAITADTTIQSLWSINHYTATFLDWDGTILGTSTVDYHTTATPPANPTRTGYTFDFWDGNYADLSEDVTIIATYDINRYTATFLGFFGTSVGSSTVDYLGDATPPSPGTHYGYTFAGWSGAYTDLTANVTITSLWTKNQYTVTFVKPDGVTVLGTSTVDYETAATAPTVTPPYGYAHTGWIGSFSSVTENCTVTAIFDKVQFTVTFLGLSGSVVATQLVTYLEAAQNVTPTAVGYDFVGWNEDFSCITESTTITSTWAIKQYTATFTDHDGTVLSTSTVDYQTAATAPANPTRAHYAFTGWDSSSYLSMVQNVTITAQYTIDRFTATFIGFDGVTVCGTKTVDYGANASIGDPAPHTGYTFTGWSTSAYLALSENLTVYAEYQILTFTVTFRDWDGTLLAEIITDYGADAVLPSDPVRADYDFSSWSGDYTDVYDDETVTATYAAKTYAVTFDVAYDLGTPTPTTITTGAYSVVVDSEGNATLQLPNGTYLFTLSAAAYDLYEVEATIYRAGANIVVTLAQMVLVDYAFSFRQVDAILGTAIPLAYARYSATPIALLEAFIDAGYGGAEVTMVVNDLYCLDRIETITTLKNHAYPVTLIASILYDTLTAEILTVDGKFTAIATDLATIGYDPSTILIALESLDHNQAMADVQMLGYLADAGLTTNDTTLSIKDVYGSNAVTTAYDLYACGYPQTEILDALSSYFDLSSEGASLSFITMIHDRGYANIGGVIETLAIDAALAASLMKQAGFGTIDDGAAMVLHQVYALSDGAVVTLLASLGYALSDIAQGIKNLDPANTDMEESAQAFFDAGYDVITTAVACDLVDEAALANIDTQLVLSTVSFVQPLRLGGYGASAFAALCDHWELSSTQALRVILYASGLTETPYAFADIVFATASVYTIDATTLYHDLSVYATGFSHAEIIAEMSRNGFPPVELAAAMKAYGTSNTTILVDLETLHASIADLETVWQSLYGGTHTTGSLDLMVLEALAAGYSLTEAYALSSCLDYTIDEIDVALASRYSVTALVDYYIDTLQVDPVAFLTRWQLLNVSLSTDPAWESQDGITDIIEALRDGLNLNAGQIANRFAQADWTGDVLFGRIFAAFPAEAYDEVTEFIPALLSASVPGLNVLEYLASLNPYDPIGSHASYLKAQGITISALALYALHHPSGGITSHSAGDFVTWASDPAGFAFTLEAIVDALQDLMLVNATDATNALTSDSDFDGAAISAAIDAAYAVASVELKAQYLHDQGYTCQDALSVLKTKMGVVDGADAVEALYLSGYTQNELMLSIRGVYAYSEVTWADLVTVFGMTMARATARAYHDTGAVVSTAIAALKFDQAVTDDAIVMDAVTFAGYTVELDILLALEQHYRLTVTQYKSIEEVYFSHTGLSAALNIQQIYGAADAWETYDRFKNDFSAVIIISVWQAAFPLFHPLSGLADFYQNYIRYVGTPASNTAMVSAIEAAYAVDMSVRFATLMNDAHAVLYTDTSYYCVWRGSPLTSHVTMEYLTLWFGITDPDLLAADLVAAGFPQSEVLNGLSEYAGYQRSESSMANLDWGSGEGAIASILIGVLTTVYEYDTTDILTIVTLTKAALSWTKVKAATDFPHYTEPCADFDIAHRLVAGIEASFPISTYPTFTRGYVLTLLFDAGGYTTDELYEDMLEHPNAPVDASIVAVLAYLELSATQSAMYLVHCIYDPWPDPAAYAGIITALDSQSYAPENYVSVLWAVFTGPDTITAFVANEYTLEAIVPIIRAMYDDETWYLDLGSDLVDGGFDQGFDDLKLIAGELRINGMADDDVVPFLWYMLHQKAVFAGTNSQDCGTLALQIGVAFTDIVKGFRKIGSSMSNQDLYWGIYAAAVDESLALGEVAEVASFITESGDSNIIRKVITLSAMRQVGYSSDFVCGIIEGSLNHSWKSAAILMFFAGYSFDDVMDALWGNEYYAVRMLIDIGLFFCSGDIWNTVKRVKTLITVVTYFVNVYA
ncbi:MAG TPA: hypothetical protein DCR44_01080 [Acholeplasmatales bacterium]|nr:MAG: hypothetical protein A2Y16_02850 [Tenericutes bacterium GWF2_57_13]HAQ55993.1 hypothetical protein [Acholeplasmatales bacterium]